MGLRLVRVSVLSSCKYKWAVWMNSMDMDMILYEYLLCYYETGEYCIIALPVGKR